MNKPTKNNIQPMIAIPMEVNRIRKRGHVNPSVRVQLLFKESMMPAFSSTISAVYARSCRFNSFCGNKKIRQDKAPVGKRRTLKPALD